MDRNITTSLFLEAFLSHICGQLGAQSPALHSDVCWSYLTASSLLAVPSLHCGPKQRRASTARTVVPPECYVLLTPCAPAPVLRCRGINVCLGGFPESPERTSRQRYQLG